MKHARNDYNNRIQDSAGIIPADEPVFLLRGQDKLAPDILNQYASDLAIIYHGDPKIVKMIRDHANKMREWQREHGAKVVDVPDDAIPD